MKKLTDKTRARLLLEMRERGGYKVLPFIRTNARGYLFIGIWFAAMFAFLIYAGVWVGVACLACYLLGVLLRDVSWFIGLRRSWPFHSKVINWDEVKKISEDEPSA